MIRSRVRKIQIRIVHMWRRRELTKAKKIQREENEYMEAESH
jgi:hypothetical protein